MFWPELLNLLLSQFLEDGIGMLVGCDLIIGADYRGDAFLNMFGFSYTVVF